MTPSAPIGLGKIRIAFYSRFLVLAAREGVRRCDCADVIPGSLVDRNGWFRPSIARKMAGIRLEPSGDRIFEPRASRFPHARAKPGRSAGSREPGDPRAIRLD